MRVRYLQLQEQVFTVVITQYRTRSDESSAHYLQLQKLVVTIAITQYRTRSHESLARH